MGAAIFTISVMVLTFYGFWRLSNLERAQGSAFKKLAARYGYRYSKLDDSQLFDYLNSSGLNLIEKEGNSKLFNIISGNFEASDVCAFTYKYETKPSEYNSADIGNVYFSLAVLFRGFREKRPVFSMFPKRGEVSHDSCIELSGSDKFNKRYVLSCEDETFIRSTFEPHGALLADHKVSQHIICDGDNILFTYGGRCTGKVVEKRIDSAHEIFTVLFQR